MLSSKTIKCLSYLNIGYYIFVIPYRVILTHDKQNQGKLLAKVVFGNVWHGLLQKIIITTYISVQFIVAGVILIYYIIYGLEHSREERFIGYSLAISASVLGVLGIANLCNSKELALLKTRFLEFSQNIGQYFKLDHSKSDGIDKFTKCIAGCCILVSVSMGPMAGWLIYSGFHVLSLVNNFLICILCDLCIFGLLWTSLVGFIIGVINMMIFYQFVLLMVGLQSMKNFLACCRRNHLKFAGIKQRRHLIRHFVAYYHQMLLICNTLNALGESWCAYSLLKGVMFVVVVGFCLLECYYACGLALVLAVIFAFIVIAVMLEKIISLYLNCMLNSKYFKTNLQVNYKMTRRVKKRLQCCFNVKLRILGIDIEKDSFIILIFHVTDIVISLVLSN